MKATSSLKASLTWEKQDQEYFQDIFFFSIKAIDMQLYLGSALK